MGDTVRFGVSIDRDLLDSFDDLIDRGNYDNRSEAVRDIIRTTHIHLDGTHCLEMIAVRGDDQEVEQIANDLISRKGVVKHGKLTATSTGKKLD